MTPSKINKRHQNKRAPYLPHLKEGVSRREEMNSIAMAAHANTILAWAAETAREAGVWLLAGIAVPGGALPHNAAVLFDPGGDERLRYHKIHPFSFANEDRHYEAGTTVSTIAIEGVRITPLICYDLRFPELFRAHANRTDLFVVIANWPESRRIHWSLLLQARAIDSLAWVLGVNRTGEGNGLVYSGDSALIDPWGETACLQAHPGGLLIGNVEPTTVSRLRARYTFLKDRQPEAYKAS